ncbi:hypothetical protein [Skermania sp. ID1734]|uniref:hypothetical protein n=1 Tax=Skermania sp. ID1734 TaxID=2597516 RepID=UPI002105B115|nr:hypothetical protein [Skermania sp. ID1734]
MGAVPYEVVIGAELSDRATAAFPEFETVERGKGRTVLRGSVDPAALQSIVARIDDMGLVLTELRQLGG